MKKIYFISPLAKENVKTSKALRIPQISLYYLAALTPEDKYEYKIVEEEHEDINLDEECDMVGISIMTANAMRGYYFGDEFKKRGKKVVIGGVHASAMPEEALQHADAVCVGEAETIWSEMLSDFENDKLEGIYKGEYPDLTNAEQSPQPRLDLAPKNMWDVKGIVCTRGCPYSCSFCCVHRFYGRRLRHVPPKVIAQEMDKYKTKNWMFLDDNIIGNRTYARELFNEITPLNKKWLSQSSISFIEDKELIKLAAKSGCKGMFFGLENVTTSNKSTFRKNQKYINQIEDGIKTVKDLGIIFHASLIFGFDEDNERIFDETFEFLIKNKVPSVTFNILTPYPGTAVYDELKSQDRLITDDWTYYDHCTAVYRPNNFTAKELMEKYLRLMEKFYSYPNIIKRFFHSPMPVLSFLMGVGFHYKAKSDLKSISNYPFL